MNMFSSIFGQMLDIISRHEFYKAVMETGAERKAKGFACWQQYVAMLLCQLGQAHSLREISGGLATCLGKLKHLGVESAPNRSTLSYANEHRPWRLYERVFYGLLDKCRGLAQGRKKFRFKNKLFSLDATSFKEFYHLITTVFAYFALVENPKIPLITLSFPRPRNQTLRLRQDPQRHYAQGPLYRVFQASRFYHKCLSRLESRL